MILKHSISIQKKRVKIKQWKISCVKTIHEWNISRNFLVLFKYKTVVFQSVGALHINHVRQPML